jgi:hypothetical protein
VILGLVNGNGLSEVIGLADEAGKLEFDIETLARREGRHLRVGGRISQDLALGTMKGCSRGHN